jgi:hypothetical protein
MMHIFTLMVSIILAAVTVRMSLVDGLRKTNHFQ